MLKIDYSGALISILSVLVCLIFSGSVENYIGLVLILSVGIIHGANDLLIIKNVSGKTSKNNYIKSFILYIFVVFLGILLFYTFPKLAIHLFVLISIFHFGEQYWESKGIAKYNNKWFLSVFLPYILHGILVFNLIFLNNLIDVNFILEKFTISELSENFLNNTLIIVFSFYLLSIVLNSSIKIPSFKRSSLILSAYLKSPLFLALSLSLILFKINSSDTFTDFFFDFSHSS